MSVTINGVELADEAIEFEFQRLLRYYSAHIPAEQLRQQVDLLRERARDQAIGAKLLIERATQLELTVPGERLDAKIEELAENQSSWYQYQGLLQKFCRYLTYN